MVCFGVDVILGYRVVIYGVMFEDGCLVGIGVIVFNGVIVGVGVLVVVGFVVIKDVFFGILVMGMLVLVKWELLFEVIDE